MATNDDEFTNTLNKWLNDSTILADTRKFLKSGQGGTRSGGGITDGQRANWRRRGLPNTFVEGAALYHCAQARNAPSNAAQGCAIEGDEFWQVFVVHAPEVDDQPMLDCTILRCWQGMRARHRGTDWFAHPAARSIGTLPAKADVHPLVEDDSFRPVPQDDGTVEDDSFRPVPQDDGTVEDDSFRPVPQDDGTVVASWEIGREPRDQGYHVHFPASLANDREDAVGGCPIIPVTSAHLLAYLPQSLLRRQRRMMLPGNPRGTPVAFSTFLNGGNPARIMESYLGVRETPSTEEDFRRLASWFDEGPLVEEWRQDTHRVPELIRQHKVFQAAENLAHEGKYEAYTTHIDAPKPFLSHFMVFGSRLALDEGVSNG